MSEAAQIEGKNFYFIGIGGIGMGGIAKILRKQGYTISGSDLYHSVMTRELCDLGCQVYIGHDGANIPRDCDGVVYSSAVRESNPELKAARETGVPVYKRAEMLGFLMSQKVSIGIAGTHGKTTTSGMISLMLLENGLDPTVMIGGTLPQLNSNSHFGGGNIVVAEADESDGTFLLLYPTIAVVTNIEEDHMDYYGNFADITEAFNQYLDQLPEEGFAIVNADCPSVKAIIKGRQGGKRLVTYSLNGDGDYNAGKIDYSAQGVGASVFEGKHYLGYLQLNVPGSHNISNALAAVALGRQLGLKFNDIAASLNKFTGTGRRFEDLGLVNGVRIVDDYAHHPTEIRATIDAARHLNPQRLICVFQPHRYSRTQTMYSDFAAAFADSDLTAVNEIYPAFEQPISGVTSKLIIEEGKKRGMAMEYVETEEAVLRFLRANVKPGDLVLIMGAGNIRRAGERFVKEGQE